MASDARSLSTGRHLRHYIASLQEELGTPALAFVRAVCDALRLDPCVQEETQVLRHNLLRLTHTREFAAAADFKVRGPSLP